MGNEDFDAMLEDFKRSQQQREGQPNPLGLEGEITQTPFYPEGAIQKAPAPYTRISDGNPETPDYYMDNTSIKQSDPPQADFYIMQDGELVFAQTANQDAALGQTSEIEIQRGPNILPEGTPLDGIEGRAGLSDLLGNPLNDELRTQSEKGYSAEALQGQSGSTDSLTGELGKSQDGRGYSNEALQGSGPEGFLTDALKAGQESGITGGEDHQHGEGGISPKEGAPAPEKGPESGYLRG